MKAFHTISAIALLVTVTTLGAENKVPSFEDVVEFAADPVKKVPSDYFKDFKIAKDDLRAVLRYDIVSRERWLHDYSHVAFGDRTGTITLKGKTKVRWMVKPGGLAFLTFPDGGSIYLVQGKTK